MKKRGKTFVGLESCLDAFGGIEHNFRNVAEEIEFIASYYVKFVRVDLKALVECSKMLMEQRDRREIETEAAIRAVEAVRTIPTLKASDKKLLAKLIKTARISISRRRGSTKNMEEEELSGNNTASTVALISRLPDDILRKILTMLKSKTDVAVASCVCTRWNRILSSQKKEKSTWYAALQVDRETGRFTTRDGSLGLIWETKAKSKANSSVDGEEFVALKSKADVYAIIRDIVRSHRRREIDSDFSDTSSDDDDDDVDVDVGEIATHRFWNVRKYL
jgi:hypothetical protein